MSAEPVVPADPPPPLIPTPEQALAAIDRALTDPDGYRIEPPCAVAPDMWFLDKAELGKDQRALCVAGCPALRECGLYAIVAGEDIGVWGGQTGLGRGSVETRNQRALLWILKP